MVKEQQAFAKEFSAEGFWGKVKNYAQTAGREVIEKTLWLYYAAQNPLTPIWAKTTIYGALGYFIAPLDAVPDLVPVAGYADDLGVLVFAVGTVAAYITDEVKELAAKKLRDWFGE
jgi:uncharacterized membrane protein YkvA (DUF1232 family)